MSEEEIIKEINIIKETIIGILKIDTENYIEDIYNIDTKQFKAILGLLDLYIAEKEKNKKIEDKIQKIIELQEKSNKDLVVLPNNECICLSDCCELIDYLKEILE